MRHFFRRRNSHKYKAHAKLNNCDIRNIFGPLAFVLGYKPCFESYTP